MAATLRTGILVFLVTLLGALLFLAQAQDNAGIGGGKGKSKAGPGTNEPIMWTTQFGMGRVFVTALGHGPEDTENPEFKITFARGAEWAASGKVTIPVPPQLAK
jgi:hypothetical protein